MKLVIDISDILYMGIKEDKYHIYKGNIYEMIKNGTPLPKGHGDLKDVEQLKEVFRRNTGCVPYFEIEEAPTIIEADKGEK